MEMLTTTVTIMFAMWSFIAKFRKKRNEKSLEGHHSQWFMGCLVFEGLVVPVNPVAQFHNNPVIHRPPASTKTVQHENDAWHHCAAEPHVRLPPGAAFSPSLSKSVYSLLCRGAQGVPLNQEQLMNWALHLLFSPPPYWGPAVPSGTPPPTLANFWSAAPSIINS